MGGESRNFSVCLSQTMSKKLPIMTAILALLLLHISSPVSRGDSQSTFMLRPDGKISAQIDNRPLNQALRDLATKLSLDLKGISVGGETVNLNLSDASLEELLKKMMRGYNYVLVRPNKSERLMLMVLSRADRTRYVEPPVQASSPPPALPQPVPQPASQAASGVAPQPQQIQRSSSASPPRSATGGQAESTSGQSAQGEPSLPLIPSQAAGLSNDIFPPMPPGFAVGGGVKAAPGGGSVSGTTGSGTTTSGPSTSNPGTPSDPGGSKPSPGQPSQTQLPDPRPPQVPF
jgi:hypothetical protein